MQGSRHAPSRCRWTATSPARTRAWNTRSGWAASSCTNGCSPRAPSARCTARAAPTTAKRAWTTISPPAASQGVGAHIIGRNMFGPVRGAWGDEGWKGWWGTNPPYHHPVFVLTHHPREPLEMAGGTTFFFVTDGIASALEQARDAAGDQDVVIGGGAATVREYLKADLIDEMHLAVSPVLLGGGERLFDGVAPLEHMGFEPVRSSSGCGALHAAPRPLARRSTPLTSTGCAAPASRPVHRSRLHR